MIPLSQISIVVSQVINLRPEAIQAKGRSHPKPDARKLVIAIASKHGHADAPIAAHLHVSSSAIRHQRSNIRRQSKLPNDWPGLVLHAETILSQTNP